MYKTFEIITEIVGWIQIVLSPTLLGMLLGLILYNSFPNNYGLAIGIIISITGLLFGIKFATKKFKTTGTIHFLSRVSATPDLDKKQ